MTCRAAVLVASLLLGCSSRAHEPPKPLASGHDGGALADGSGTVGVGVVVTLPPAPPLPPVPAGLPPLELADVTPELVALGERLFQEPLLAGPGAMACSRCHDAAHGFSGATRQPTAAGTLNARRAPTLVNLAWQRELGWDGRYASVAEQLAVHLEGQLGTTVDAATERIAEDPLYRAHFARSATTAASRADTLIAALAAYTQTRFEGDAPWDRMERDPAAPGMASSPERAGYQLFTGKAQCSVCHAPPLYTDLGYHAIGLVAVPDPGRGRIDATRPGAFKTPTLRGAARRVAFFHDGSATTLTAAIDWHLAGGTGAGASPASIDPALRPVTLTATERAQLGAFVVALTRP